MRSPEGVEFALPIATPAPRIAAYVIDFALVACVVTAAVVLLLLATPLAQFVLEQLEEMRETIGEGGEQAVLAAMAPLLIAMLIAFVFGEILYFGTWEALARGITPGKYFMRLRVVSATGQVLEPKAALLRNLLRMVDVLPSMYVVGLFAMVASPRGQRLGDHAAGTLVIRTDRVERPEDLLLPEGLELLALSRAQQTRLGARELTLIRSTLRRYESPEGCRFELVEQAAAAIVARLELPASEASDPVRLLQRALLTAQRLNRR